MGWNSISGRADNAPARGHADSENPPDLSRPTDAQLILAAHTIIDDLAGVMAYHAHAMYSNLLLWPGSHVCILMLANRLPYGHNGLGFGQATIVQRHTVQLSSQSCATISKWLIPGICQWVWLSE